MQVPIAVSQAQIEFTNRELSIKSSVGLIKNPVIQLQVIYLAPAAPFRLELRNQFAKSKTQAYTPVSHLPPTRGETS